MAQTEQGTYISGLPEHQKASIDNMLEAIRNSVDTAQWCNTFEHMDIYGIAKALREASYLAETLARYGHKVGIPENTPVVTRRRRRGVLAY